MTIPYLVNPDPDEIETLAFTGFFLRKERGDFT
jgi:hypothetical protein